MAKIFITGATGQIGSHLAEYLVNRKELGVSEPSDLICLARSLDTAKHLQQLGVQIILGDILDLNLLNQIMADPNLTHVFHFAAMVEPTATFNQLYAPNVTGTKNMLDAFIQSSAQCFIFTSSISCYQGYLSKKSKVTIFNEESPLRSEDDKEDPYSRTKIIGENLCHTYAEKYPDKTFIIVRPGVVIGARDRLTLPAFVKVCSMRGLPKLINGGKDTMAITSPYEIARALVFLANQDHKYSGQPFNITGDPVTYREIFTWVCEYYGINPPRVNIPLWLYIMMKPFMLMMRIFFPHNRTLKTFFSPTALNFIGKTMDFTSEKLKSIGFQFETSIEESIKTGLAENDPNKEQIKPQYWDKVKLNK